MSMAHRNELKALKESLKEVESDNVQKIQLLNEEVAVLSKELKKERDANAGLRLRVEDLSGDNSDALQKVKEAEKSNATLKVKLQEATLKYAEEIKAVQLAGLADRLAESTTNSVVNQMIRNAFDSKEKELSQDIAEKKKRIFDLECENMLLHERAEQLSSSEEKLDKEVRALKSKLQETSTTLEFFANKSEDLQSKLNAEIKAKDSYLSSSNSLQKALEAVEDELERLKESSKNTVESITAQFNEENRLHNELQKKWENQQFTFSKLRTQAEEDSVNASDQIGKLKATVAELVAELQKSTEDAKTIQEDNSLKSAELERLHERVVDLTANLTDRTDNLNKTVAEKIALSSKVEELESARATQSQWLSKLQEHIKELETANGTLTATVAVKTEQLSNLKEQFEQSAKQMAKITSEAEEAVAENKDLHKKVLELHAKNDSLRDRMDALNAQFDESRRRVADMEMEGKFSQSKKDSEVVEITSKLHDASAAIAILTTSLAEKTALHNALQEQKTSIQTQLEAQIKSLSIELEDSRRHVIALESEKEYLHNKLGADSTV